MKFANLFFVLVVAGCSQAAGQVEKIGAGWISLPCDAERQSWQGDTQEWTLAGDAALAAANPANLITKPGTGVLANLLHVPEKTEISNLTSAQLFSDIEVHVEFLLSKGSNAGVKLQGLYEIQLRDTHGKKKPAADDSGGIYPRAEELPTYHTIDEGFPPLTNAAKPAGEWQTLDLVFHAPRFDGEGRKTRHAHFAKVEMNGKLIHENVQVRWPTGGAWRLKPEVAEGPLFLQGDHGPIAYRNVRVRPLKRDVNITPDVVYGHKHGMALTFDVFEPAEDGNGVGVLFMVSGGWYSRWQPPEQMHQVTKPLTDRGFTVFTVRHGSSPKYELPEIVEDVRRSVRFIRLNARRFNVDPERLGVYGGSAGGHLSLMLGTASDEGDAKAKDPVLRVSDRVAAVVALVPPTDLRIAVWESPESLPASKGYPALDYPLSEAGKVSPLVHVSPDDPPTLVISGVEDKLVPIRHSHAIRKAFEEHRVVNELVLLEKTGHDLLSKAYGEVMGKMVAWFERHLLPE